MGTLILVLFVVAFVLMLLAAFRVAHARVDFLPLALAFALLAFVFVRGFPP